METTTKTHKLPECPLRLRAAKDALEMISGKWKLPIIISLSFGNKRFGEISRDVEGISPKMLSKELRELELNKLVTRKVYDSIPVTVEYSLTELGHSLDSLLSELYSWGDRLRQELTGKPTFSETA